MGGPCSFVLLLSQHTPFFFSFFVVFFRWGSRGVRAFPRSPRSNSKNHIRLHEKRTEQKKAEPLFFSFFICLQHFHKIKKRKKEIGVQVFTNRFLMLAENQLKRMAKRSLS